MKKRLAFLCLLAAILLGSVMSAFAQTPGDRYVLDYADVLTDEQELALNDRLREFREKQQFDLVVCTTDDVAPGDRKYYADGYYDSLGYGFGEKRTGALLLVNVDPEYGYSSGNSWISTCGDAIDLIDDDDIASIGSKLTPLLLEGRYAEAFDEFAELTAKTIRSDKLKFIGGVLAAALGVGVIAAFIRGGVLKKELISVYAASDADEYYVRDSLRVNRAYDRYLYSHLTRTERQTDHSHSSSGSGSSHGGGGF